MPDEISLAPTPTPAIQPESMHGPTHSHGSLHLIVGMLGVLLVLETVVFGYVVKEYVVDDQVVATIENDDDTAQVAPAMYVKDHKELYLIDQTTGQETLVYEELTNDSITLFAIPQVGYNGKVYISTSCNECDSNGVNIKSLDLTQNTIVPELVGQYFDGSIKVSPDQTQYAYVLTEAIATFEDTWTTGNEIRVLNLVTGEKSTIASESSAYFFTSFGTDDLRGRWIEGFHFTWNDRECIEARVYARPQVDVVDERNMSSLNTFIESREYCQE